MYIACVQCVHIAHANRSKSKGILKLADQTEMLCLLLTLIGRSIGLYLGRGDAIINGQGFRESFLDYRCNEKTIYFAF